MGPDGEPAAGASARNGSARGVTGPGASAPVATVPGTATTEPLPGTAATCTSGVGSKPRLWLLTTAQYEKTVATLFKGRSQKGNADLAAPGGFVAPFNDQPPAAKFSNIAAERRLTAERVEQVFRAADDVSQMLLATAATASCVSSSSSLRECLSPILKQMGELLFRRPLAPEEVARYAAAASDVEGAAGRREGARLALRALLVAPQFLLRSELGVERNSERRLDAFEVASALSYGLTEGPPDQALWDDAVRGALAGRATIEQHVARLLAAPEGSAPMRTFVRELFSYTDTIGIEKDEAFHNPELLVREANAFLDGVLKVAGRKEFLKTALTGRAGVSSPATAASYGAVTATAPKVGTGTTAQAITFQGERQGILGHPAWLSSFSQPERNDPVARGAFVQRRLLCGSLPKAPIDAAVNPIGDDTRTTLRQKFVAHVANPTCRVCHALMDGIGLGFEGFDHYGRTRTTEAGKPVDRSGVLLGAGAEDGLFEGLEGLVGKLVSSDRALGCFVSNAFEGFMGRAPVDADACALDEGKRRYVASGGDLTALLQAFYGSDVFLARVR